MLSVLPLAAASGAHRRRVRADVKSLGDICEAFTLPVALRIGFVEENAGQFSQ